MPWSARRVLQTGLALVWLLDAALQCQPVMFTTAFVTRIIEPAAAGNPAAISAPMAWSAHLMARHIAAANTGFALIQFAIGAGLLFRRTTKAALAASIAWSVAVWWFGEGLGGVLAGASPLAGTPGAVLLYALIALLIWPRARDDPGAAGLAAALHGPLGPRVAKLAWLALWGGFACYLLLPGNRGPDAVSRIFAAAPSGGAGWARLADTSLASATAGHGLAVSVLLAVLCAMTGIMIFSARLACPAVLLACLLGWTFWLAEGFGGLATGQATDPNTGPLLILLAACFWPPATTPGLVAREPVAPGALRSRLCRPRCAGSTRRTARGASCSTTAPCVRSGRRSSPPPGCGCCAAGSGSRSGAGRPARSPP